LQLANGMGHITYSTLVHAGDTWDDIWASLRKFVPQVKKNVCPTGKFGVSLRISHSSSETLINSPEKRAELRKFLDDNDMYLYTVNAFPYGPFKNQIVKEQVYEPDWSSEKRLQYTMNVATILAEVAPDFVNPSIQTPPLGFKPNVTSTAVIEAYAENIRKLATHVNNIYKYKGRTVTLAIEPEPACFLETTKETIDFFNKYLRTAKSYKNLAGKTGATIEGAKEIMARHVGIVYDICHQALEYEDITKSLAALKKEKIAVWKLQQAAAMMIPVVTKEKVEAVKKYAKTIYLTQTHQRDKKGKITRYLNLEDAIAAWEKKPVACEWRIHFHVPVFLEDLGPFKSTRFAIEEAMAFQKKHRLSDQLEIETYTWDVLPDELKTGDIVEYVTKEIEWVKSLLV
jgi:sugar phosphate isomerase/epimerase